MFEFSPSINLIYGLNARGKTTILEAIHLLMTGRSFRTSKLNDLIKAGASSFYVEAHFIKNGIEQNIAFGYDGKDKNIIYNSTKSSLASSLLGIVQGVSITPDDANLIKGGPAVRRHYLDLQIAQADPLYVHHFSRFHRAMRQRNILLKEKKGHTLEQWEAEMSLSAAYLMQKRQQTVQQLEAPGQGVLSRISGQDEKLKLCYKATVTTSGGRDLQNQLKAQYQKLRPREMYLGHTLVGPHKDDLTISISDKEARFFASEGQQRSCVLALRFAEWECLNQEIDEPPVMLLDDIAISLDQRRREILLEDLPKLGQVFITNTDQLNLKTPSDIRFITL